MSKSFIKINHLPNIIYTLYSFLIKIFNQLSGNKKECAKISYSQCGEDIIVEYLLNSVGINKPTYLDIGANDAKYLNNTYHFYERGSKGYLIEPDLGLYKKLKRARPRDISLNLGIGDKNHIANFYIMSSKTLNTYSKSELKKYIKDKAYGEQRFIKTIKVPMITPSNLIENYIGYVPDFLSIDTEGFDKNIVQAIDFKKYRPKVICIETARCIRNNKIEKSHEVYKTLLKKGYFIYADTFINTILVDVNIWNKKYGPIVFR